MTRDKANNFENSDIPETGRSLMGLHRGRPPMATTTEGVPDFGKIAQATKTAKKKLYCRKCQRDLPKAKFYAAVDPLDTNGYMSICQECINTLYKTIFQEEKYDINNTLNRLCRMINVKYSHETVVFMKQNLELQHKSLDDEKVFGEYKKLLMLSIKDADTEEEKSLCYSYDESSEKSIDEAEAFDDAKRTFAQTWGDGYEYGDYLFLENKFAEYSATCRSSTAPEVSLLRQICFEELHIQKCRLEGDWKELRDGVKQLQDLMKTASIDPGKVSAANGGQAAQTFSGFVNMIEETEPADWLEGREVFKDVDNIEYYFNKHITRPIKSFITGSRDYSGVDDDLGDTDESQDVDEDMPVEEGDE